MDSRVIQETAAPIRIDDEEVIDLRQYFQVLRRRKAGIFGLGFLAALIAALAALSMTPIFKSTATLMIESDSANVVSIEQVYGIDQTNKEYYQTQFEILKSRKLTEVVIDRLGLAEHPEFKPMEDTTPLLGVDWKSLVPDWRAWLPQDLFPNVELSDGTPSAEETRQQMLDLFAERLSVTPVRNSQLVNIGFESSDRQLAADVANTLSQVYIENEMDSRLEMTATAVGWLTGRLTGLRDKLETSEKALQDYREKEQLVEVQGVKTLTADQIQEINQKLVFAQQQLAESRATYNQVRNIKSLDNPDVDSVPAVLRDPLVATLKEAEADTQRKVSSLVKRYGPKHPKMIAAKADLKEAKLRVRKRIREVMSGLEKEYKVAGANVQSLRQSMGAAKGEIQKISRKGYQLGVFEREVETNRQLYELFLGRLKETSETSGMQSANARVVDPAVPAVKPSKPKKKLIVLVAAFVGLFLGIVWAFLLEHLDNTLKGSGDMEDRLGLPVLGLLPHLALKKRKGESPLSYVRDNPQALFSESLRTVRTGILLSGLDEPHKVIVVTSSGPSEGKTSVATTVADSLADMHKVLLIDADMRRPTLGAVFGLDKAHPGLSEFVAGSVEISDCVHKVEDKDLYVLPSGTIPPNPLELLSSKRFGETISKLSESFDQIIIDCPPTLAVSDPLVVSTVASGVIYVVRADMTPYPMAQEGLKRLRKANAHILGGVLNQVPMSKKGGYGKYGQYNPYGDQYYGSYGYTSS